MDICRHTAFFDLNNCGLHGTIRYMMLNINKIMRKIYVLINKIVQLEVLKSKVFLQFNSHFMIATYVLQLKLGFTLRS
jgi:hypothetical protein